MSVDAPEEISEATLKAARAAAAFCAGHPDATASDPLRMGWMTGSPPPAEKLVLFADGSRARFPQLRWAFCHQRELVPTKRIWRGAGGRSTWARAERADIDDLSFRPIGSERTMTWAESLAANWTDGIVVVHRGRIVHERYFGALTAHGPHLAMSVTKSFVGTLAASLIEEGEIDAAAPVTHYVPELGKSAFADASVRQVLDMRSALRYSEDYTDPDSGIANYARAAGLAVRRPEHAGPESITAFLASVEKLGRHGEAFAYKTVNTDVIAWIVSRVTEQSVAAVLESRFWGPLGMEEDAYLTIDSHGTGFTGGGLNTCLRDLARFGEMMRCEGAFDGRQVVPAAAVADIRRGGERGECLRAGYPMLPGWSYRSMWWVTHDAHGAFSARGIHGQALWIDPAAEMVIARYASHPGAANGLNDWVSQPAYRALGRHLRG